MCRQRQFALAGRPHGVSRRIETDLLGRFFLLVKQSQKLIRVKPPGC